MTMHMMVQDVRDFFVDQLQNECFTTDRLGGQTIELLGASFVASESAIFGKPNPDYIARELRWYNQQSTNINDIYVEDRNPPKAWQIAANKHGEINSNYGKLIYSSMYGNQYINALNELIGNPDSRRACMVYNRPSIWHEYNENGKNDFICTNAVNYYIRDGYMDCVVQMRSNDAWAGYRNDVAWQSHVLGQMVEDYNNTVSSSIKKGIIHWQVSNLHIYDRNFYLIDAYAKGHGVVTKGEYREMYPNSSFA